MYALHVWQAWEGIAGQSQTSQPDSNLFQDAEGSMRLFIWHKDQKAVSHCLTAILQMAQT